MIPEEMKQHYLLHVGPYALSKGTHHIVYWTDARNGRPAYCWTLAIFKPVKNEYQLQFVGKRPFESATAPECSFMEFAHVCQKYLDAMLEVENFQAERDES